MSRMKRVMLIGGGGQTGQALSAQKLPADWQIDSYDKQRLDITDHLAVRVAVESTSPDIVINTAALTSVDVAEKDSGLAVAVNFDAPANIAAVCSFRDIPLIHLSTDFVFDGEKEAPYSADDEPCPVNAYGQSKMYGEDAVRQELAWHVILRVSWVFSAFGNNMMTKMLSWANEKDELRIATDQISCPTYAGDVAQAIIAIADEIMAGKSNGFGTFHYCGTPAATRYEFAEALLDAYRPHAARMPKLLPALTTDFPEYAKRPRSTPMDCSKIREIYGIEPCAWRDRMEQAILEMIQAQQGTK